MPPTFIPSIPIPHPLPPLSTPCSSSSRIQARIVADKPKAAVIPLPSVQIPSIPPTPADWLRRNEGALRPGDEKLVTGEPPFQTTPGLSASRDGVVPLSSGLLNLVDGGKWLYTTPISYCRLKGGLEEGIDLLKKKVFYLGPVTRNKVVRAVELAREGVRELDRGEEVLKGNVDVALIVADLQMDCETVCAALLRGVVGRKGCEQASVVGQVGADVVTILDFHAQVETSVHLCGGEGFTELSFSNLRELILVGAMDEQRAISLELARAVLEIRKLEALSGDVEKKIVARRSMYLYAPLANQMGMWYVQGELEELAFMYLEPASYEQIRRMVGERRRECESTLLKSKEFLERMLSTTPKVRSLVRTVLIKGRVKGLYSVYRKMRRSGKKVYEIYDLLALRVIVQPKRADDASEIASCYAVAEAINTHYETFESRAKDYIAAPKRNGYRSVHLTVVPRGGTTPLEIQIRTDKMHHVAEFGAAAHWIYKETSDEQLESSPEHPPATDDVDQPSQNPPLQIHTSPAQPFPLHPAPPIKCSAPSTRPIPAAGAKRMKPELLVPATATTGRRTTCAEAQERMRKGYVTCLGSAIRASRVIVAAAGQLYGLAVGSTVLELARGLGVAGFEAVAVVNGSVAPLTQRLEMNDIVRFILM